ncbi:unnamed protein product [Symbiodinium sp. CCMP2592]|nr:unnamed protein product [Symbiodinium sp. CCMP2592]
MMDFLALLENDSADAAADEDGQGDNGIAIAHPHLALAPAESVERNDLPQQSDALVPMVRVDRSKRAVGIALELTRVRQRGNRFRSTVKHMQIAVASAFMNQQALFVARLVSLCTSKPPLFFLKHIKWDETQLLCTMNADKSSQRVRSSWQVMVVRIRIVLVWEDGSNMVVRLIVPPVSLLATGAEHQYYALSYHPAYKCLNGLLGLLRQQAEENMDLSETDGASSNNRLIAHLIQQAKTTHLGRGSSGSAGHPLLLAHCRCMNHAVQLNSAAILGTVSATLLNRVYGMTIFIRNLGYWLRIRQAIRNWVGENLRFRPEVPASNLQEHVQPHPALQELIAYLRMWKKLEKQSAKAEDDRPRVDEDEDESSFDRKAAAFLDMWNGNVADGPCHVCSCPNIPPGHRHCADRAAAVKKCSDTLLDLFVHAMPGVPSPSKWTKLHSPLDFCLAGTVVHNWLEHAFRSAFSEMVFQEFPDSEAGTDPRLVEALSFHAVNGRRFQSSMSFLQNTHEKWAVGLLAVALEPNRVLTWYWLSCLGHSLSPGERPPLYCLLDPSNSVLTTMLFASCWMFRRHYEYLHSESFLVAIVGLARALKTRHVTAEELQTSRWKKIFAWFAATLQLSIADVEVKHAANRSNAESGFSTIAAKFVNSDSHLVARQARQKTWPSKDKDESGHIEDVGKDATVVDMTKRRPKGQSALELFRKDWLHRRRMSEAVNPATKAVWDEVRAAWRELSDEQKQVYTAMAASSGEAAASQRRQNRRATSDATVDKRGTGMNLCQQHYHSCCTPKLLNAVPFQYHLETADLKALLSPFPKNEPRTSNFGKHGYPVSEASLSRIAEVQRQKGISARQAERHFDQEMERLARPPDSDLFPDRVVYESYCGCQCRHTGEDERIALHVNLLQSFLQIVKQLGSPMEVVRSDVLLSFEVLSSTRRHVVRQFAWVSAVSARAGALKPEQTFVLAEVADCGQIGEGMHRFDGLYLDLCFEPHVQCKKEYLPAPPDEPAVGRLRMFVSDSFAFHLLSVFDDHPGLFPGQVVINRLLYEDCTPRRVRVVGFDANFQRVLVSVGHGSDVHEAADPMFDGAGAGRDDAGPSAGSDMDFLALLDDNDILDDPDLQGILGADNIAELKRAIETCTATGTEIANNSWMDERAAQDSDSDIFDEGDCKQNPDSRGDDFLPAATTTSPTTARRLSTPAASSSSASSSAVPPLTRAGAQSSGPHQTWQLLKMDEDGAKIEVMFGGTGTDFCSVRRCLNGKVEPLGLVKKLTKTTNGQESLRALCKKHTRCECWVTGGTAHSDLILEWLAVAPKETAESHARLASELKRSVGMKVRG